MMSDLIYTPPVGGTIIRSFANQIGTKESFRLDQTLDDTGRSHIVGASTTSPSSLVDISWLSAAAEQYCLSSNIKDYVIAEVPIVEGDVPNRNMHCFLTSRLLEFLPKHGCQAYRTFVGKPTFYEHQHDDHTKAKGVILDASMRNINGRWFVMILKAFDRTKDAKLAEDIQRGKRKGHSMSAYTSNFDCGFCGHRWNTQYQHSCEHVKGPAQTRVPGRYTGLGQTIDSKLVYAVTHDFAFFESSSVGDPANFGANQLGETVNL